MADWHGYFNLSTYLFENSDGAEGWTRSGVSRSYYACLNLIRKHLEDNYGLVLNKERSTHVQVKKALEDAVVDTEFSDMPNMLRTLKEYRVSCDYHDSLGMTLAAIVNKSDILSSELYALTQKFLEFKR
jgi:hypothetical protein